MLAMIWLNSTEEDRQRVWVIDDSKGGLLNNIEEMNLQMWARSQNNNGGKSKNLEFVYESSLSLSEAKSRFQDTNFTAILYIPEIFAEKGHNVQLFFKKQPSGKAQRGIERILNESVERIKLKSAYADLGLEGSNVNLEEFYNRFYGLRVNVNMSTIKFKQSGEEEEVFSEEAYVGLIFAVLIYIFILMYGIQVMRGVIEEKTNRIVEVIISSVKPFQLMMGKILGVGFVGLTQFLLWIVLTFGLFTTVQPMLFPDQLDAQNIAQAQQVENVLGEDAPAAVAAPPQTELGYKDILNRTQWPVMIGMFIFYFLFGFLLYSALFAAIGSAVDSETETQQFMFPITLPLLMGYMISFMVVENPDGAVAYWFSQIPFTSPVVMMVRIAIGVGSDGIPISEIITSMVILIGTFLLLTWLAGRIYRTGILMYGKKASYRELIKWLTYKN